MADGGVGEEGQMTRLEGLAMDWQQLGVHHAGKRCSADSTEN